MGDFLTPLDCLYYSRCLVSCQDFFFIFFWVFLLRLNPRERNPNDSAGGVQHFGEAARRFQPNAAGGFGFAGDPVCNCHGVVPFWFVDGVCRPLMVILYHTIARIARVFFKFFAICTTCTTHPRRGVCWQFSEKFLCILTKKKA